MTDPEFFTPAEIDRLIRGEPISHLSPWATGDERLVDDCLRAACDAITVSTGSKSKVEWEHYGSGYASYVDAWFYKETTNFDVRTPTGHGHEHTGLVVLLSRLSPYVVFMEGERRWHASGAGSSYMPSFEAVDQLETPGVMALAQQVQALLEQRGLLRVTKAQLAALLTSDLRVPTILTDGPFRHFDALIHWED